MLLADHFQIVSLEDLGNMEPETFALSTITPPAHSRRRSNWDECRARWRSALHRIEQRRLQTRENRIESKASLEIHHDHDRPPGRFQHVIFGKVMRVDRSSDARMIPWTERLGFVSGPVWC